MFMFISDYYASFYLVISENFPASNNICIPKLEIKELGHQSVMGSVGSFCNLNANLLLFSHRILTETPSSQRCAKFIIRGVALLSFAMEHR